MGQLGDLGTDQFLTGTLINVTKQIFKSNTRDAVTSPTGCAASLIDGKTHYCSLQIPTTSKIFYTTTTNVSFINAEMGKYWYSKWK